MPRKTVHKEPVKLSANVRTFLNKVILAIPFEERVRSYDDAVIWLSQHLSDDAKALIKEGEK